jgi:hypothetical protein
MTVAVQPEFKNLVTDLEAAGLISSQAVQGTNKKALLIAYISGVPDSTSVFFAQIASELLKGRSMNLVQMAEIAKVSRSLANYHIPRLEKYLFRRHYRAWELKPDVRRILETQYVI